MYSLYVVALFTVSCFHPILTSDNLLGNHFLYLDINLKAILHTLAMTSRFATTDVIEQAGKGLVDLFVDRVDYFELSSNKKDPSHFYLNQIVIPLESWF